MPSYYNPYNFYPASYVQTAYPNWNSGYMPMQQSGQQGPKMMEWVEGEVGAKAFQMPNGWPANSPIPLWDSTDTVIWLKSWGPMGIPNPLQKLRYEMPENQNQAMLTASGGTGNDHSQADMSQYVTRKDLEEILRKELREARVNNQNGSNNTQNGNRGGGK